MENLARVNQCKWPWFEQCLMIWGKTAKACGTAGGMDNGVPKLIRWVELRRACQLGGY
jgi:hypothetical protein